MTALVAAIPWIALLRHDSALEQGPVEVRLSQVARTKLGWLMAVFFGLQSTQAYSLFGWFAQVYRDAGFSPATAGVLLGDDHGLALMRFRPSLWEPADECYLAELYVRPAMRGRGLGRALLEAAMRHASERGATYMDLATTNKDEAAVALYESVGFDRHERRGPETVSYYYEIDLTPQ